MKRTECLKYVKQHNTKQASCWMIMCTRSCCSQLQSEDIITILINLMPVGF